MATDGADPALHLAAHAPRLRLALRALAGRAVRARIELDDLLQEVFVRALAGPPLPDDDAALGRLLVRIARHVVIDVARAARASKRSAGRAVPLVRSDWSHAGLRESQLLGASAGPATRVVAAETERRWLDAFDALDADHRRVITLRQIEGLSARDAAQRMGRTESAVHSLYRRALEAWSRELKGDDADLA